jgi:hypothetical protein
MGGESAGELSIEDVPSGPVFRLSGRVSLDNNGGFIQMAADIDPPPPGMTGLMLDVSGNGEEYNVHLRTSDLDRPWQSYRASFVASDEQAGNTLPTRRLQPHRTDAPFNAANIRRIGIVAIGREFDADVRVYSIAWY